MRTLAFGFVFALVAVMGLFLGAGAHDGHMLFVGMVFFAFGVAMNFWLIARSTSNGDPITGAGMKRAAD